MPSVWRLSARLPELQALTIRLFHIFFRFNERGFFARYPRYLTKGWVPQPSPETTFYRAVHFFIHLKKLGTLGTGLNLKCFFGPQLLAEVGTVGYLQPLATQTQRFFPSTFFWIRS
jgi:hypothetical protein